MKGITGTLSFQVVGETCILGNTGLAHNVQSISKNCLLSLLSATTPSSPFLANVGISQCSVPGSIFFSLYTFHSYGFDYHSYTNNSPKSISLIQSLPEPQICKFNYLLNSFIKMLQRHADPKCSTLSSSSLPTSTLLLHPLSQ